MFIVYRQGLEFVAVGKIATLRVHQVSEPFPPVKFLAGFDLEPGSVVLTDVVRGFIKFLWEVLGIIMNFVLKIFVISPQTPSYIFAYTMTKLIHNCFILQYIYYNPLYVSSTICSSSGC